MYCELLWRTQLLYTSKHHFAFYAQRLVQHHQDTTLIPSPNIPNHPVFPKILPSQILSILKSCKSCFRHRYTPSSPSLQSRRVEKIGCISFRLLSFASSAPCCSGGAPTGEQVLVHYWD